MSASGSCSCEDLSGADLSDRLERMLALPLPRVAPDENERARALETGLRAGVGADQERQPLDGGKAAKVEKDRLRGEGKKLLLPVGNAPRPPALVPALRLLDQPAAPEGTARLTCARLRPKALQLDAAGQTMHPRALEPKKGCHLRLGARRHDQPRTGTRPAPQPLLPDAPVPPVRTRPGC